MQNVNIMKQTYTISYGLFQRERRKEDGWNIRIALKQEKELVRHYKN